MQRPPKSFENTIIYKLVCNDRMIPDIYIGHTTNFRYRQFAHKNSCYNSNHHNYNCTVYEFIRNNHGWENWRMEVLEECNCKNSTEARARERFWIESLKPSLNVRIPNRTKKEYGTTYSKNYYQKNRDRILKQKREKYHRLS